MTDLAILLTFMGFLAFGTVAPFFMSLGYVWVDNFYPQFVARAVLGSVPVAFIMGAAAFFSYILMDRRSPPRITFLFVLYLLLALWITLTTTWAAVPEAAWFKWDVSFKTLLFSAFIPFVFRSRVQIEAFAQVLLFSVTAHILPWGLKTMLTGGGYGQSLGLLGSNAVWLSESSTIAAVCIGLVPLLVALSRNNLLIRPGRISKLVFYGLGACFLIGAIGTFARTAIIGLVVMGCGMWWRAKRKVGFSIVAVLGLAMMFAVTTDQWTSRVSTIADYKSESSALVRTLVWKWTWDYVQEHPFGGGFNVFVINTIIVPGADGEGEVAVQHGRAFHNAYFAVLGEHGYLGLLMYLTVIVLSFMGLQSTRKMLRDKPDHVWCYDMAGALQITLATILVSANFVDISFYALVWDLLALSVCLREYAHRVAAPQRPASIYLSAATTQPAVL